MQTATLNDTKIRNAGKRKPKQTYIIELSRDEDANVWIAISDEIPIALESDCLDTLVRRVKLAAVDMLEHEHGITSPVELLYREVALPIG